MELQMTNKRRGVMLKPERLTGKRDGGYILLAVLVFIALLLPLTTLVLSTVGQETIAANNLIVESKTKSAADAAVKSAISLVVERNQIPDYFVSNLPQNIGRALIVDDNGVLRWDIANNGAGVDEVYGTNDDWYVGPFRDRQILGPTGTFPEYDPAEPRNYHIDYRFVNQHKPTYLAENWAWFGENNPFAFNRASGRSVYLYNQFAAGYDDGTGAGLLYPEDWQGYHPDDSGVFPPNRWVLPGYYTAATLPPDTEISGTVGNIAGGGDKGKLAQSVVALNQPLKNSFGLTEGLESEFSITDESGRLNLNIFCKKMPVWASENVSTDFNLDGEFTDDFNYNEVDSEQIWKWIDNPLFPDRDTVIPIGDGTGNGTDFNGNEEHEIWLGENLQHYYAPDWVDYATKSIAMLTALPGVDERTAKNVLRTLNPDLSTLPSGYNPDPSGVIPNPPADRRADAPNLSPQFYAFYVDMNPFGQIVDVRLLYENNVSDPAFADTDLDWDDVPLPRPRPFTNIKQLMDVDGMTKEKYRRLRNFVTVYSYDTNVIGTELWDSEPGTGDSDDLNDVRYNVNNVVQPATLTSYRQEANSLVQFMQNHLMDGRYKKFTFPVLDRMGNARTDVDLSDPDNNFQDPDHQPYHLNPEFTYDSALSIVLYRNGYYADDAYNYDPISQSGTDIRSASAGTPFGNLFGRFFGGFSNSFIPIEQFQPSYVADSNAGRNVNAYISPHNFSSVADLLEVPLYKFDNLAISAMVDTPSAAVCNDGDTVTVQYLVSFSDVITAEEYDSSTGQILPTYTVIFDWDGDGVIEGDDAEITVDATDGDPLNDLMSLRTLVPTPDRPAIVGTFDLPQFNQLRLDYPAEPWNWRANNYISFSHTFTYDNAAGGNIPDRNEAMAGRAMDFDFDGRNDFAFDAFGNPFITARISVIKNMTPPGGPDDFKALRADTTAKAYLQHNCSAFIPLKTNILAMRTGNNSYQVISRSAGGRTDNGPVYIYNWTYSGFPDDDLIDGIVTNPADWGDATTAPSIMLEPSMVGSTLISLEVYDVWGADPAAVGFWAGANGDPYTFINQFLTVGDPNFGNPAVLAPINGPGVDTFFNPPPGPPDMWQRIPPGPNYDHDTAEVFPLSFSSDLYIELAAEMPSIYQGQYSVLHAAAYGGRGPYHFQIAVNGPGGYFDSFDSGFVGSNKWSVETEELTTGGTYSVQLTVTDSSTPIPLVKILPVPEAIEVGTSTIDTELYIDVPNLTVSAKVIPYQPENPANARSFMGVASVSGGRNNYLIRWDVRREDGSVITQNYADPPGIVSGNVNMTYTQSGQLPVFRFDPTNASDGVYFVYCSVIDSAGINPNLADSTLATDVVPILLTSSTAVDAEPRILPNIYAAPPGNTYTGTRRGGVALTATLGGPPQIGTFSFATTHESIEPRFAPANSIIEIRGVNFNNTPSNNLVTFEPNITTTPFDVYTEVPGGPGLPDLQVMRVLVPQNARSGFVVIRDITSGRTSQVASPENFFNTNWTVSFDLYAVNKDTYAEVIPQTYRYEVDFQGDGIIDWSMQTQDIEVLAGNTPGLVHDYSSDGIGNYQATLRVTNILSQKSAVSHQLVQMRELSEYALTLEPQVVGKGLTANILPDYRRRQPLATEELTVKSFVDGITNRLGVGYKWVVDGYPAVSALMAQDVLSVTVPPTSLITSDVLVDARLDALYATPDTAVEATLRVRYPFNVADFAPGLTVGSECSTFTVNMGDGSPAFALRGVVTEQGQNYSIEVLTFEHIYTTNSPLNGSYRGTFTVTTPWGVTMPDTFNIPRIRIQTNLTNLVLKPADMGTAYAFPIVDLDKNLPLGPSWFSISGNYVALFYVGQEIYVRNSNNNDGLYHVVNVSYDAGDNETDIFVDRIIQTSAVNGEIFFIQRDTFAPNIYDGLQHLVGLTVVHNELIGGENFRIKGSDTIVLPILQQGSNSVFSYLAFNESYALSNAQGSVEFNMLGILGASATLDYKSDINSDGRVDIGGFMYPNPHNRTTPLRNVLNPITTWPGASPTSGWHNQIPGVPQYPFGQISVPYTSSRGIYTSWAMVSETMGGTITARTRNIAIDTQEIMVGGRRSSSGGVVAPPLAVDAFVEPLLGTSSQNFVLNSYVSGGSEPYIYLWRVYYNDGGNWVLINLNDGQETLAQSYFTPDLDAADDVAGGTIPQIEGEYRIDLTVQDASGVTPPITDSQFIRIVGVELYAQVFANPPAATFNQNIDFWVYADGGASPYTIYIDYGDGSPIESRANVFDQLSSFTHAYSGPVAGTYHVKIEVVDVTGTFVGGVPAPSGHGAVPDGTNNYSQSIAIGDRLPLNISIMASPVSGVDAFPIQVHYAVGGGVKGASGFGFGGDYIVGLSLLNDSGVLVDSYYGVGANTFGNDGRPDTTTVTGRPPVGQPPGLSPNPLDSIENLDRPVTMFVPGSGKFFLQAVVLDGDFQIAFNQITIYSEGYVAPTVYDGLGTPRVRYTLEPEDPSDNSSRLVEKPLHAVRIWQDPLYEPYAGSYPGATDNDVRLFEADLQILGELFTVDPNPNLFFSSDFSPVTDPLRVPKFEVSLASYPVDFETIWDFYDTFTFGRVNINTAPEEVLAAIFSKIIVERGYYYSPNPGDPEYALNGERNYETDVLISPDDAYNLARAVVDYRNSFYDAEMPSVPGYGNYTPGADGVRVNHMPVIGPWDGANPLEYENDQRDASLPDYDNGDVDNVYDNYAGNYYNLENGAYKFYSPSDVAQIRKQLPGETDEDYAKYLNNAMINSGSATDEGFDARYYIEYDSDPSGGAQTIEDARNGMAIIRNTDSDGNEHVVYSFIPNPPFESIYDLYKVLGMAGDFTQLNPDPTDFTIDDTTGRPEYDEGAMPDTDDNDIGNVRTFSGPSVFKYLERWVPDDGSEHLAKGQFEVVSNFLADIEPYITTRSYMFRVEGKGIVPTSDTGAGNALQTGRTSRGKSVVAIVDIGPLNCRVEDNWFWQFGDDASQRPTNTIIYRQDLRMDDAGF
jgi:hypothetical protein